MISTRTSGIRYVTHIKIAGTKSTRIAAAMLFGEFGGNLTNPDKNLLEIYIADEGYTFVQPDQSGAEALVVAYEAEQGNFRNLFLNKIKPHTWMAMHLFPNNWTEMQRPVQYYLDCPIEELNQAPNWTGIRDQIQNSGDPYDIGKRVIHACCDDATEVLTYNGWVKISEKPKQIMVSDINGISSIESITWNEYDFSGQLELFEGKEVNQCVTSNHKMVYETNGNRKWLPANALALQNGNTRRIPISGNVSNDQVIPIAILKLAVAIQADGSYTGNKVIFHFKKQRKIDRLNSICKELGIENSWWEGAAGNKVTRLSIEGAVAEAVYLLTNKQFDWRLLYLSVHSMQVIINEVQYWDGSSRDDSSNRIEYFSSIKSNVEIINTIARMCGHGSTMTETSWGWTVSFNRRTLSYATNHSYKNYNGKVYCPITSKGFFWIRRSGKISLTGNSNYRMGPGTFQLNCLKQSAGLLNLSYGECKLYLGAYKRLFPEIVSWQAEIEHRINTTRELTNPLELHRHFYKKITDAYIRDAISWIPQSTVGCITNDACIAVQDFIERENLAWDLLSQKHDSYMIQCPDDVVEKAIGIMRKFMEVPLKGRGGIEYKMKTGVSIGKNWGKFKPEKNPLGMKEL